MRFTAHQRSLINLATAFVLTEWTEPKLRDVAKQALEWPPRLAPKFVKQLLAVHPERPTVEALLRFIATNVKATYPVRRIYVMPRTMRPPPPALASITIPQLPTENRLAEWLGISVGRLKWYADVAGRNRKHPDGPLRTYHHRWIAKPNGRSRLIEIPQTGLKLIQRRILAEILDAVPPHSAAHGFRACRSILTNADHHCGKEFVLRFDLRDFFPSVPIPRVFRIFRTIGYPEAVSRLLAALCTTRLPRDVWDARPHPSPTGSDHAEWMRLASRHLPQGAPTSPALANLVAYRLDVRLAKLASTIGANYTRYADDLTFSGGDELAKMSKRLETIVAVIAAEEGFAIHHRKTKRMRRGGRQVVAGVVVNVRPNLPRKEFDRLKAILTNCVRHGPASQNLENHANFLAHLAGRISHFVSINPTRSGKLKLLFDRIDWMNP